METAMAKLDDVVKLYDNRAGSWKVVRKDKGPFKSLEIIDNTLRKLGLSKNQIRVYLYLARSGIRKASQVSEAISLHRTETYRILRDLAKIGLVSSVLEKPLKFVATPFDKSLDILITAKKLRLALLERRKEDLMDVWVSLPKPEVVAEAKEVFQVLEGEEQIDLKARDILEKTKNEISFFVADSDLSSFYHSGFIDMLEKASRRNISVRLLTNNSPKSCFFAEKLKLNDVKYVSLTKEELPSFLISDQGQLLFSIKNNGNSGKSEDEGSKVSALWTNYEAFIKALKTLFSELWDSNVSLSKD
jgi:sugar-specific transcriptional regulator TrmB